MYYINIQTSIIALYVDEVVNLQSNIVLNQSYRDLAGHLGDNVAC